eukprot:2191882-Prorocentrum_lima.AAC.1
MHEPFFSLRWSDFNAWINTSWVTTCFAPRVVVISSNNIADARAVVIFSCAGVALPMKAMNTVSCFSCSYFCCFGEGG